MDDELTIPEAARRVKASEITVRRRILSGELRARKILGRWRISVSELDRFLETETTRTTRPKDAA